MGNGGSKGTEDATMTWVRVDHFTARPTVAFKRADPETGIVGTEVFTISQKINGDPQLHSHCIIPNYLVTETGRFTAIPKDLMRGRRLEFGAVYQAFLAKHLRGIGVNVALHTDNHMAHISAVPEAVCDEFSKRTADAQESARAEAARRGLDWDQMTDQMKIDFLKGGAKASRRSKSDDLANIEAWRQQAEAMGWKHETVITGQPQPTDDRVRGAYETALPLMAERLQKHATLFSGEARIQAARGLIAAGIETTADIDAVVKMMADSGVVQDGKKTKMYARRDQNGQMKLTTALHLDQEEELIDLARAAYSDRSRALSADELARAELATGLSLTDEQRHALSVLGSGGAFGVFIGAGGTGKTASVLSALSHAYKARGYTVWGTALAWRQANALEEAGIDRLNCRALQPLLDAIQDGRKKLDRSSVVIIDELSQVSIKQLLDLLLMQAKYGFQIIATGDDRQCQSVDAGAVIDLLRKALGKEAIAEILSVIRQKTEREKEICRLFRENKVDEAIAMKREDGTAIAADGSYQDVVEAVSAMALEKNATVSAPTNKDALEIGRAIRLPSSFAPSRASKRPAPAEPGSHPKPSRRAGSRHRRARASAPRTAGVPVRS
ncbi:MAG TPA: AAA family ATPase [Verrucomicrobiae bacterium]|nr:AAA family ATPase [Verrucomicrobiae bacterium]